MAAIEFWFDYISHNAYLAWCKLQSLAPALEREVQAQPVLFAGLLNHHGGKGPAEVPRKNAWMIRNVLRKAARDGVVLRPPASHPFNPLLGLRATLCVPEEDRNAFVDGMFHAVWAQSRDPADPATIAAVAEHCGLDGAALCRASRSPDIKDNLHMQTRNAIHRGIFGVPSMLVDGELFWGYDDLEFLRDFVEGRGLIREDELRPWLRVKPSSIR